MNTKKPSRWSFFQRIRFRYYRLWEDPKNIVISIHIYLPHSKRSIKKIIDNIERREKAIYKIRECIESIKTLNQYHAVVSMIEHYGLIHGKDAVFDDLLQSVREKLFNNK